VAVAVAPIEVKPVCRKENHFTQSQSLGPRLVQTNRQRDINTPMCIRVSGYLAIQVSEYLRFWVSPHRIWLSRLGLPTDLQTIHRAFEIDPMAHLRLATSTLHLAQSAYGINRDRAIKKSPPNGIAGGEMSGSGEWVLKLGLVMLMVATCLIAPSTLIEFVNRPLCKKFFWNRSKKLP